MLYTLSLGSAERNISKQLRQAGAKSKAISNRPVLLPGLEIYWNAFFDLHPERDGSKLIPTGSIMQYARENDFSKAVRVEMVTLVREIDFAYTKHHGHASRPGKSDEIDTRAPKRDRKR